MEPVEQGKRDIPWYGTGKNETTTQLLSSAPWQAANPYTYSGLLRRLQLIKGSNMPPMQVLHASRLEGLGCIPRSSDGHAVDAEEAVRGCGADEQNRPKAVLVMFSHRWLRPVWPDPDGKSHPDDERNVKAKALIEWVRWFKWWRLWGSGRSAVKGITLDPNLEIFLWIDFCSVDQDEPGPGMAALPAYVSTCAEMIIFSGAGYNDRAWCAARTSPNPNPPWLTEVCTPGVKSSS